MWEGDPLLLVKYTFVNIGESPLSNIYFGQFMDFDIVDWAGNMGRWEPNQGLGFAYMYNASDPNTPYIGIAMFDSSGKHTNSALAFTTGLYPNSEYEFSNWMRSDTIESATPDPRDYAILIASQPCNLPAGYSKAPFILAFAVGESLEDLKSAVNQAYQRYAGLLDIDTRQDQITPTEFTLHPAYPNPFNPVTTISYSLPKRGKVVLAVYNLLGEEIARLVEGERSVGYHQVTWDASDVASGIYLFRLSADEFVQTKKMILLK